MERERERNEVRKPRPRIIWACACGKTHRFKDHKGEWAGCGFHCTRHPGEKVTDDAHRDRGVSVEHVARIVKFQTRAGEGFAVGSTCVHLEDVGTEEGEEL